jgi:hypothetical protein
MEFATTIILPSGEETKIGYETSLPYEQVIELKKGWVNAIHEIFKTKVQNWQPCGIEFNYYTTYKCYGPTQSSYIPNLEIFYLGNLKYLPKAVDGKPFNVPIGRLTNITRNEVKQQVLEINLNNPKSTIDNQIGLYKHPNSDKEWNHNIFEKYEEFNHSRNVYAMQRRRNISTLSRNAPTKIILHRPTLDQRLKEFGLTTEMLYPKN